MEKEIYLTEAPYYAQSNQIGPACKEKIVPMSFQSRPNSAKLPNKKLNQSFYPQSYYEGKQVKPGIVFFKIVLDIEQRRSNGTYKGPLMKINIPQTVLLSDNSNFMIFTENGVVKVEPFTTNQSFVSRLQTYKSGIYPSVVHSSISGIGFSDSIMMNTEIVNNKIIPRSEGFICRKFVSPYASTPNILRLYYYPKNNKQLKRSYGYKFINNKQMDEDMFRKKHRLIHNYIVNSEKQDFYTATLINGKALGNCQSMAESLAQYLEKGVGVKIHQIVLDFIVNQEKQPWLFEIKMVKSKTLTNLWDIGNGEEMQLLTQKNNNSQFCKLCGMTYSKNQMGKIVTSKLIWELIKHLQQRGVIFKAPCHLKKQGLSYVCEICYEVVVAEHRLINIEKEFSNLLNISPNTISRVHIQTNQLKKVRPIILNQDDFKGGAQQPKLKAWRLFFYIEKIKNYCHQEERKNVVINLEMRFKNFRQHFTKTICGENPQHIKMSRSHFSGISRVQSAKLEKRSILHDKFNQTLISRKPFHSRLVQSQNKTVETATTMASKVTNVVTHQSIRETYSIQKVKVYVIYTKKHQTNNIFTNTEVQFNLHINDEHFKGRSATLQELKNRDTCQRHSSEIFLFDQKLKYCNLELTVGLICDGDVTAQNLALEESEGFYYPANALSSCRPLPDEWMEVFTKGQSVPSHHSKQLSYDEIKQWQTRKQSRIRDQLQNCKANY